MYRRGLPTDRAPMFPTEKRIVYGRFEKTSLDGIWHEPRSFIFFGKRIPLLGANFCHQYLEALDWPRHFMILCNINIIKHTVYGDHQFMASRKLDLIVPLSEAQEAMKYPSCLLLMMQPLDTSHELFEEEADLTCMQSQVSDECLQDRTDQACLDDRLNVQYKHLFEPRVEPPPEWIPGKAFKIQLVEGATPQYRTITGCHQINKQL